MSCQSLCMDVARVTTCFLVYPIAHQSSPSLCSWTLPIVVHRCSFLSRSPCHCASPPSTLSCSSSTSHHFPLSTSLSMHPGLYLRINRCPCVSLLIPPDPPSISILGSCYCKYGCRTNVTKSSGYLSTTVVMISCLLLWHHSTVLCYCEYSTGTNFVVASSGSSEKVTSLAKVRLGEDEGGITPPLKPGMVIILRRELHVLDAGNGLIALNIEGNPCRSKTGEREKCTVNNIPLHAKLGAIDRGGHKVVFKSALTGKYCTDQFSTMECKQEGISTATEFSYSVATASVAKSNRGQATTIEPCMMNCICLTQLTNPGHLAIGGARHSCHSIC